MKSISPDASPPPSSPPQAPPDRRNAQASAASLQALPRTGGNHTSALIAFFVLLAGCGGSNGNGGEAPTTLPPCAKPKQTISRPDALPERLPVPPGTLFTRVEVPFANQSIVSGVSPGDLQSTRSFYGESLEDAGYEEGRGESEPGETEALFSGPGVRGGWRANVIPGCEGAVRLTLVIVASG
jgi:hypothetical protein